MALALARRYRPRRFSELLVQDHVAAVLRGAVLRDRVGHGYLLTGPRGVGKTTAARILAMALNCERKATMDPPGEPCGQCAGCQRIWAGGASLDVVEIDAASNRGVDDARELRERAMYAASEAGHHKVYIVDEAHMLTREAWNALLKILEEPPPGVVFVFATTEPQKIAQAAAPVLSRLQRFDFHRIGPTDIRKRLVEVLAAEKIGAEEDALTLIARHSDGGMRDALSVLDQCLSLEEGKVTTARVRAVLGLVEDELYAELLALVAERRPGSVFPLIERLMDAGADLATFLGGTGEILRALLMLQLGTEPGGLTEAMRAVLQRERERFTAGDLLRMLRMLTEVEPGVRRSGQPQLLVETLLLRWAMLDRVVDLQEVLAGGPPPASPAGPVSPASPAGAPARSTAAPAGRGPAPRAPAALRDAAPVPATREAPAAIPSQPVPPVPGGMAFTLPGIEAGWDGLLAAARAQSRFVGEALAASKLESVVPPDVTIQVPADNPMYGETLERAAESLEKAFVAALGAPVRLRFIAPGAVSAPAPARRYSEAEARAERLGMLAKKDPALEAAARELDLEIVE
jgi:DNA polymerase-3 subunit gamma/tau